MTARPCWLRRVESCAEASPTMAVKRLIATIVPRPKDVRYAHAQSHEGIASAGITPSRWPVPVQPCRMPVMSVDGTW